MKHIANTVCLLFPWDHNVVWSLGQVAAFVVLHRLPAAIRAQQLEVIQFQTLSPCFIVISWVEKRVNQPDLTILITGAEWGWGGRSLAHWCVENLCLLAHRSTGAGLWQCWEEGTLAWHSVHKRLLVASPFWSYLSATWKRANVLWVLFKNK